MYNFLLRYLNYYQLIFYILKYFLHEIKECKIITLESNLEKRTCIYPVTLIR